MGKPVPTFWWRYDRFGNVIVQSDYPGGARLATFPVTPGVPCADEQIKQALALIEDFKAGRKTPPWDKHSQDYKERRCR